MGGEDFFGAFKVGNGAGYLQDAVVGASGEVETFHGGTEETDACLVRFGILVNHALGHLGVAVDALHVLEAFFLNGAGFDYSFADSGG